MSEFNQSKYIQGYIKEHYKAFRVNLKKEDWEILTNLVKKNGFKSNTEFLLKCIEIMQSENNNIKKEGMIIK